MKTYYELTTLLRIALMLALFLVTCTGVCLLQNRTRRRSVAESLLAVFCCIINGACMILYATDVRITKRELAAEPLSTWFCEKPVVYAVLPALVSVGYFVYLAIKDKNYRKKAITGFSIHESLDHLTTGLCVAYEKGRIILMNHRMNRLSYMITGQSLQNANSFWDTVSGGEVQSDVVRLTKGSYPRFLLPDGTIWTFTKDVLDGLIQITAADTTRLHALTEELKEKNIDLAALNLRLRKYGENVEELTRSRERLETKARIHSELGQALLATRRYLVEQDSSQKPPVALWKQNISGLRMEAELQSEEPSFEMLMRVAGASGITIEIEGQVPEQKTLKKLFCMAAIEAMTNAVRHADAKTLWITTEEEEAGLHITFTNDGAVPEQEITEGGGLCSLRRKIESAGGLMTVEWEPEYRLIIELTKERGEDK